MLHSVVYLRIAEKTRDFGSIWKKESIKRSTGSGSVIKCEFYKKSRKTNKKFILTNAHCVQNSSFIECIKPEYSRSYSMSIYDICAELDLALLEPVYERGDEEDFWDNLEPILVKNNDIYEGSVFVVGFPQGGANPSITRGIISRYIYMLYNNSIPNVAIQIDAAINPGNSGGPVFDEENNVVGIAFSHNAGVQNVCYIIPASLILRYISDITKNGRSDGICDLGIEFDSLENIYIRNYILPDEFPKNIGIIIKDVDVSGTCSSTLIREDILYRIDDEYIDQNGMILVNNNRVPYWYLIRLKQVGDSVTIHYVRKRKQEKISIVLKRITKLRVPKMDSDINNQYYIFGGLVFQNLSFPYIFDGKINNPSFPQKKSNLLKYTETNHETPDDEIVILSEIFPSKYNSGYRQNNVRLMKINDINICSLRQVYQICETLPKPIGDIKYIKFEFDNNSIVILNWKICLDKSLEIASPYTGANYHNF
jgi:S1-C subfamily serine protease